MSPSFFFNPAYKPELDRMFPRHDLAFYIVSRYLLHPTNDVWGMITRFYDAYLKNMDEWMSIQFKVLSDENKSEQNILDQILVCTLKERLLPAVVHMGGGASAAGGGPHRWRSIERCTGSWP
jgi:xyloglucan fucosyltransferase